MGKDAHIDALSEAAEAFAASYYSNSRFFAQSVKCFAKEFEAHLEIAIETYKFSMVSSDRNKKLGKKK